MTVVSKSKKRRRLHYNDSSNSEVEETEEENVERIDKPGISFDWPEYLLTAFEDNKRIPGKWVKFDIQAIRARGILILLILVRYVK